VDGQRVGVADEVGGGQDVEPRERLSGRVAPGDEQLAEVGVQRHRPCTTSARARPCSAA
jgi:hypothetical protein